MVKATINFDDELYRKLIKETVERYGKMRGFSKLVNEKLRKFDDTAVRSRITKDEDEEIKWRRNVAKKTFGIWKIKETGAEYVRRIRDESEKRRKRLGL